MSYLPKFDTEYLKSYGDEEEELSLYDPIFIMISTVAYLNRILLFFQPL